jgi:hypothetical protein
LRTVLRFARHTLPRKGGEVVDAKRLRALIAVLAAAVLLIGAGVAYASNSAPEPTSTGGHGAQVVDQDDSDGPGDAEEPRDADEPGDINGPGDAED